MTATLPYNAERLPPLPLSAPDPLGIAEAAVASANGDGGLIALATRTAAEIREIRALLRAAENAIRPTLPLDDPERLTLSPQHGWTLYVPRGQAVYALEDGRVLVRTLHGVRELDGKAIRQLAHTREQGDFEAESVPGATAQDLSETLLADFAERAMPQWEGDALTLWQQLGALTPEGGATVAGILLFGHEPQRWLPAAHVHFEHSVAGQVIREEKLGGPLVEQMRALWEVLTLHARISGPRPPYAPALVREILFNALVHRDYRLTRQAVAVRLTRTDLVVESPGGLSGYLTDVQDLAEGRYLRNPRLYFSLTQWGACKERGACALSLSLIEEGYPSVHWEADPYTVRVTIERCVPKVRTTASLTTVSLSEQQQRILRIARQRGSVTLRELQARWGNGVRPASLQRDLDTLVAAGYLRRFGGRSGVYYVR